MNISLRQMYTFILKHKFSKWRLSKENDVFTLWVTNGDLLYGIYLFPDKEPELMTLVN